MSISPVWTLLVVSALLCGCDSTTHACGIAAKRCKREGLTEFTSPTLQEEPRWDSDYESGRWERAVQTGKRSTILAGNDSVTVFEVETDRPSQGTLSFVAHAPWSVVELPASVRYTHVAKIGDCLTLGAEREYTPDHLVGNRVGGVDGLLVIAGERSRLLGGGEVERAPENAPEIDLSWVDVGCAGRCGEDWRDAGDELWHVVALKVSAGAVREKQVLPGERIDIDIDGQRYVFVLEVSERPTARPGDPLPPGAQLCGRALWSLYREGLMSAS
jgi:hypothetical protein